MAMRWSPPESLSAPLKGLTAGNVEAVVEFLDFGAHGAQLAATSAMRSDSLTRSSLASRMPDAVLRVGADGREDGQFHQ